MKRNYSIGILLVAIALTGVMGCEKKEDASSAPPQPAKQSSMNGATKKVGTGGTATVQQGAARSAPPIAPPE